MSLLNRAIGFCQLLSLTCGFEAWEYGQTLERSICVVQVSPGFVSLPLPLQTVSTTVKCMAPETASTPPTTPARSARAR